MGREAKGASSLWVKQPGTFEATREYAGLEVMSFLAVIVQRF